MGKECKSIKPNRFYISRTKFLLGFEVAETPVHPSTPELGPSDRIKIVKMLLEGTVADLLSCYLT